jgi:hypothetical protein
MEGNLGYDSGRVTMKHYASMIHVPFACFHLSRDRKILTIGVCRTRLSLTQEFSEDDDQGQ